MSREWKRGDVAGVKYGSAIDRVGLIRPRWLHASEALEVAYASGGYDMLTDVQPLARPLLVLDPEDADQMRALWDAYLGAHEGGAEGMADAVRDLLKPAPPKPEEPTGLGAVVEDETGERWVKWRLDHREDRNWRGPLVGDYRCWANISAVSVLSEGVQ